MVHFCHRTQISDEDMTAIAQLAGLEELGISFTQVWN